jgi:hypothetical protein
MAELADRVYETTTSTGTGSISLGGAVTGYQTFVSGIGDGNSCAYVISDGTSWEVGVGTVTAGSPDTLSRDTVKASSNGGAAVDWGAGEKDVFNDLLAYRMLELTAHIASEANPHNTDYSQTGAAPAAQGVTNGDSHDHSGGDGGQIAHSSLSDIGTDDHHSKYTDAEAQAAINADTDHSSTASHSHNDLSDIGTDDHHSRYTDAEAQTAINNDADHGSTAAHNYFSGDHADLTNVNADDHHSRYTDSEAITAINSDADHSSTAAHSHDDLTDVGTDDHHSRYTDAEAVEAIESANVFQQLGYSFTTDQVKAGNSGSLSLTAGFGFGINIESTGSAEFDSDIKAQQIKALDSSGLQLTDDGGNGMQVQDGGDVAFDGGVYLGGTAAANLLDDYEEGTYTATIYDAGNTNASLNVLKNTLAYEKVGDWVHVHGYIEIDSVSGASGKITISLPFAVGGSSESSDYSAGSVSTDKSLPSPTEWLVILTYSVQTGFSFHRIQDGAWGSLNASDFSAGDGFIVSISYRAA